MALEPVVAEELAAKATDIIGFRTEAVVRIATVVEELVGIIAKARVHTGLAGEEP